MLDYKKDNQGRIITIKIEYQKQKLQIASLYAPDRPHLRETFFQSLRDYLFEDCPLIMGGDYNMVEDVNIDRHGGTNAHRHTQGIVNLRKILSDLDLHEKWRLQNRYKEYLPGNLEKLMKISRTDLIDFT